MSTITPGSAFAGDSADALRWCQRYSRRHGENFTVVSWFLPRELRAPMFAVYAFCRFTDNLGDDPDADATERLERLDAWHEPTSSSRLTGLGRSIRSTSPCSTWRSVSRCERIRFGG